MEIRCVVGGYPLWSESLSAVRKVQGAQELEGLRLGCAGGAPSRVLQGVCLPKLQTGPEEVRSCILNPKVPSSVL
jgi:hypothetical protein